MYFTESYESGFSDYNEKGVMSLEAVLRILENTGCHHMFSVKDNMSDGNVAWIVADWRIEIARRPGTNEKLSVTTWVRGKLRASICNREFIVKDETGEDVICASSKVALMDLSQGRIVRLNEERLGMYKPEERRAFESDLPRLTDTGEAGEETHITLRRSDIDYNGHVHNTKYIAFALEALPEDAYEKAEFSSVRIVYRSPVKPDDDVTVRCVEKSGAYLFYMYTGGHNLCTIVELK